MARVMVVTLWTSMTYAIDCAFTGIGGIASRDCACMTSVTCVDSVYLVFF